jgi:DUF2934 family protein
VTPEPQVSTGSDHFTDAAIHDEIKHRAYKLYEQRGGVEGHDAEVGLQAELPRALYAAAELEKYTNGEVGEINSVRAARVYLRALSAYIAERGTWASNPSGILSEGFFMKKLYVRHTRIGPFYIVESAGNFHVFYQDDALGIYPSADSALADVVGGHTFSIAGGIDTATLGIPERLNEWSRLL